MSRFSGRWLASALFAIVLSATLLVLSLPLGEQGYLGWVVFVPVLRVVRGRGFLVAFAVSLGAIFTAAALSVSGRLYSVKDPLGDSAWLYTCFGIFGFSVCLAIGAWGDRAAEKFPAWWFAALAVLAEAYLLIQLPAHLALSQYRCLPMLWVASLGGIWLVSFVLWWSNFALARLPLKHLGIACAVAIPVAFLAVKLHLPTRGESIPIGVVQISDPDERRLAEMQAEASARGPDFVVWPEFAGIIFTRAGSPVRLTELSKRAGLSPIVTSYQDSFRPLPHNASALFADGKESPPYFKRKLFGSESKMHTAGTLAASAPYQAGRVGLNICYDSCFPEIIRDTARLSGVNVISLPSIDPYATHNFVAAFHAAYCPFRSAEEGIAMVKADGLAYSTFVDPYGQIVSELPAGDRVEVMNLPFQTHWTLYRQAGDWFLALCGFLVGLPAFRALRTRLAERRQSRTLSSRF